MNTDHSPKPRHQIILWLAGLCLLAASVVAARLAVEAAYRLHLYWNDYNAESGMNHVADGFFTMVYLASITMAVGSFISGQLFRSLRWRVTARCIATLNLALCIGFGVMNHMQMLVTYSEFISVYGP